MVELATRLNLGLTFKAGSAEDLPFADGTFDAVGCNFGMHHFPHPEKALAEASASRILRPGGRIAFTVWASRDKAIALGMVLKAIEACGETDFGLPEGPPFFRFSDRGECTRVLLEADIARSPLALSKGAGYAYS
jgi:SAM-dependent methyltransferase